MAVPYTFGTATAAIPLSQLDTNFATAITLGNTAVYLGNTTTSIGNLTLTNATISSGSVTITDVTASGNVTLSGGTANGVAYLNGSKVLTTGSALVFDGTNLGVGVTPSAWVGINAVQVGNLGALSSSTSAGTVLSNNAYATSAGWAAKYITTGTASFYEQIGGAHYWLQAASGTAGNAITFTQALTLNTNGALVLQGGSTSASGVGVAFPATQSASSDANTLDDYEEGTWTPNQGTGIVLIGTFSSSAKYTKIGRQVTLVGQVNGSTSVANVTNGGALFSNAPFAPSSGAVGVLINDAQSQTGSGVMATNSIFYITPMSATPVIYFTVTYFV
jgi:hypothetical protein